MMISPAPWAILQSAAGALADIQLPAASHSLKDGSAIHRLAENVQLSIFHVASPVLAGSASRVPCPTPSIPGVSQLGVRQAGGGQGRRRSSESAMSQLCVRMPANTFAAVVTRPLSVAHSGMSVATIG